VTQIERQLRSWRGSTKNGGKSGGWGNPLLPELCQDGGEGRFPMELCEVCARCANKQQGWCLLGLYGEREMTPECRSGVTPRFARNELGHLDQDRR
jgi:hypothetical protein